MRVQRVFYRGHDPKWAWEPLSGSGAALKGGRFNAKGQPALYLANSWNTVWLEMGGGLDKRLPALTICSYDVDCEDIADLTSERQRRKLNIDINDMGCAWLELQRARRVVPSWSIASSLVASGYAGALFPSFAYGAEASNVSLVLWHWSSKLPHKVEVIDSTGRLPKNHKSWS